MAGEGVVLSWAHTTEWLFRQGLLQRIGPWRWETGAGFYLVWRSDEALTVETKLTRDWIMRIKDEWSWG